MSFWGHRGTAGTAIANSLKISHLSKSFAGRKVIDDFSLTIKAGEIIALLGASGCGKSTLLRMIAGIETPDSGAIFTDNRETTTLPPEERGIGFVFQDYALFPHLTNIGNVKFGLKHLPRDEAVQIALRALERVGLADRAYDYPDSLSGGMQQRVALARAIAPRPGILLMDEPFSGLDKRLRQEVRDETLAVISETRATCLIVTHDPEEAMLMADRIALLKDGKLIQIGTAKEIYLAPADLSVARFFSDINEVSGEVFNHEVMTPLGRFDADYGDGRLVTVIIRPESIILSDKGEGVEGRIVKKRFSGVIEHYEVAIEGLERPIKATKRAGSDFPVGQNVVINIIRNETLVFAAMTA
jgi:iron(III) transport system ATP-binding protein